MRIATAAVGPERPRAMAKYSSDGCAVRPLQWRHQNRGDGERAPYDPFHETGEVGLDNVAWCHECHDEPSAGVCVYCPPRRNGFFNVGRIANEKGKYAHSTNHHGGQDDQRDAGQYALFAGHDYLHAFEKLATGPSKGPRPC